MSGLPRGISLVASRFLGISGFGGYPCGLRPPLGLRRTRIILLLMVLLRSDVFSLSLWDKACFLYPTSRNPAVSYGCLWPFKHDLREWGYRYIEPVYSFFAPKWVVFPMRGEPLPDKDSFPRSIDQKRTWILSFVRLGVLFMN